MLIACLHFFKGLKRKNELLWLMAHFPTFPFVLFGILDIMISHINWLIKENEKAFTFLAWNESGLKWICLNNLAISGSWELPILLKLALLIGKQVLRIFGEKWIYIWTIYTSWNMLSFWPCPYTALLVRTEFLGLIPK